MSEPTSIRDELVEYFRDHDDYWPTSLAEAFLASPVMRRIQAEAWDQGYWLGINGHTGPGNPFNEPSEKGGSSDV